MKPILLTLLSLLAVDMPVVLAETIASTDVERTRATNAEAGSEVTLRWKAKKEERAYGYLVYRAERREGPYRRVSERIIRITPDAGEASAYAWTDHGVVAGTTYFYYLDVVSTGGIKQRFSGVLSRVAPDPDKIDEAESL